MNSAEHKAKAEQLIEEYGYRFTTKASYMVRNSPGDVLALAQLHAMLATIPDPEPADKMR